MNETKSYIEIEEIGKVKREGNEINQKTKTRIVSELFGEEAEEELNNIKERWQKKKDTFKKDHKPVDLSEDKKFINP